MAKKTTEFVLLFHKQTAKLVFFWPNMSQKSIKVLKIKYFISLNKYFRKEDLLYLMLSITLSRNVGCCNFTALYKSYQCNVLSSTTFYLAINKIKQQYNSCYRLLFVSDMVIAQHNKIIVNLSKNITLILEQK